MSILCIILYLEMWSGLLPPGVNESDVDTSSDEEPLEGPVPILKEERELKDFKEAQTSDFKTGETESKPVSAVTDDTQKFQTCPSGVSLDMWNVGLVTTPCMTATKV